MLEGKSFGLLIFMALNVLGVAFLLYVLAQFSKEKHKSKTGKSHASKPSVYGAEPRVFVVAAPIASGTSRENTSLTRFPVRGESGQRPVDQAVRHAMR
jgi:hypothetical protein